jgi:4-carboxymuconolactone decarboxylase
MSSTTPADYRRTRLCAGALALSMSLVNAPSQASTDVQEIQRIAQVQNLATGQFESLTARQQAIVPVAAFAAAGDMAKLNKALNEGLDAGLTVSDAKEVLVQLYAYAGFPRSLNALAELMKVLEARKQRGIQDAPGYPPSRAIPKGEALLAAGTANQTKLSGGPVKGPLFDFAAAIDEYLKTHLFGDIFERDNLDWQSRELATVSMLSALPGAESQLQAHMRISMNVGLTVGQLRQLAQVLTDRVDLEHSGRAREALERHLATVTRPGG